MRNSPSVTYLERDLSIKFIFNNFEVVFEILTVDLVSDATRFLKTRILYSVELALMIELISLLVAALA